VRAWYYEMRKYYVNFGKHDAIMMAANPIHACILMLQRVISYEWLNGFNMPITFKVSERGFQEHEEDEGFDTLDILRLLTLSSRYDEEEINEVV